ncbi:DUF317 domain-containing protein [Streptomyces sp. NPDC057699]|uniref:DUF317 domain-containing protein n=1 Tax=Streptomyces sp. NPDC057699 TaxID=3346220 RepID=UPI0036751DD3
MWWTIAHHEPYWQIEFSRQTPSEAIASVTQALPQLLGDHRHTDRIPLATESTAHLSKANSWEGKADSLRHDVDVPRQPGQKLFRHLDVARAEMATRARARRRCFQIAA